MLWLVNVSDPEAVNVNAISNSMKNVRGLEAVNTSVVPERRNFFLAPVVKGFPMEFVRISFLIRLIPAEHGITIARITK